MKEEHWAQVRVTDHLEWAPGLHTLRFDTALDSFRPGQFVAVGIDAPEDAPGDEKRIHRLYSIASAPGEPAEFFIVEVPDGAVSPFLTHLQPGDSAWVHRDPKGVFTLDRVPDAEVLWLISTGTGLAPFISLIRTDEPWERFERIVVVQGARKNEELAYADEFERHRAKRGDRLSLVRTVTREDPEPGVYGGRITSALADGKLEEMAGVPLDPKTGQFMLCGNPAMIDEMTGMLHERGFRDNTRKEPGHLTFERYW